MGSLGQSPLGVAEQRFVALYRRHFGLVWSLTAHFGVPAGAREDVAQEVWLAIHRRLDALRPEASSRAWVAAITRNVALHHHRAHGRRSRKHAALLAVSELVEHPRPADTLAVIAAALRRLEPGQREVFLLVGVEELSGPEAAEVLGLPLNTVYSRLRLARARLAAVVADDDHDAMIAALRVTRPPQASVRVWLVLAADLGLREASPGLCASLFAGKLAAVASTAAAATVATVLLGGLGGPRAHARPRLAEAAAQPIDREPTPPSSPEPSELPVHGTPALAEAARVPVAVTPSALPSIRRTPSRPHRVDPSPSPAAPAAPPSTLAAETALLGAATHALADGDPAGARTLLRRHAEAFPNGALAIDRRTAMQRVACALGEPGGCPASMIAPKVAFSLHARDGSHGARESGDEE